jgi:hypothetical protein
MPTSISNPASFSSVRTAFNTEGYGISNSLFAYRQGGGIVPATAPFNAIGAGTAGDPLQLSQFSGFSVPSIVVDTVFIEDLFLTASVGDTFNGTAFTSLTFNTDGTLNYYLYVLNSGSGRSTSISQGATTIASGGISLVGFVSGMWKLSGNASDYEIFIAKNGVYTNITNATNNAWTNMNAQISLTVNTSVNDAINQEFNVSIRSASTQAVLASALITMDALAAGSN